MKVHFTLSHAVPVCLEGFVQDPSLPRDANAMDIQWVSMDLQLPQSTLP